MKNNQIIKSNLSTLLKRYKKSDTLLNIERSFNQESIIKINPLLIRNSKYLNLKKYSDSYIDRQIKILQSGRYEPLIVRPIAYDKYEIIIGRSYLKAAQKIKLESVNCIVYHLGDEETLLVNLSHLMQQKDTNIVEEAILCSHLKKDFRYKNKDLCEFLNLSPSQISNMLQLLNLKKNILSLVLEGKISYGHAKAFSRLNDEQIDEILNNILEKNLSVRETENLIKSMQNNLTIDNNLIVTKNKITLVFDSLNNKEVALKRIKKLIDRKKIKF